uniref:Uncharacterized protein n=1 Tax=Oryza meridionalis TaxID=40149 RepID=A0A0E0EQB4_9ORYZ
MLGDCNEVALWPQAMAMRHYRSAAAQPAHFGSKAKYEDVPPAAIDLFKERHCSNKTGFY